MSLTLPKKLAILIAAAGVLTTIVMALQLFSMNSQLWRDRETLMKGQVQSAVSILSYFGDKAAKGEMSETAAKSMAAGVLASLRYGNDDYFFANDYNGIVVAHPKSEKIGQNQWDNFDKGTETYHVRNIINAGREGGGFVPYMASRVGSEEMLDKLSYSKAYEPWQWVVGTGLYTDDLHAQFIRALSASAVWQIAILGVLVTVGWLIARSITRPLAAMTSAMRRLASGDKAVEVPGVGRHDEIGEMAGAVQVFKEQAIERERLQKEAEAARVDQEEAKRRQADLEHAKAEDLREFMGVVDTSF
ncbi:cache domain-containing protein, partial [Aurantimonas sp. 22II-16-19i]|uniref:cache domain-containing protein n=1 Tax=Aurantimonas sp. 22II-16-19i TaxID=1317114 RepID=UPI0009F7F629